MWLETRRRKVDNRAIKISAPGRTEDWEALLPIVDALDMTLVHARRGIARSAFSRWYRRPFRLIVVISR